MTFGQQFYFFEELGKKTSAVFGYCVPLSVDETSVGLFIYFFSKLLYKKRKAPINFMKGFSTSCHFIKKEKEKRVIISMFQRNHTWIIV